MEYPVSDRKYELTQNNRTIPMVMMGVGVIAMIIGMINDPMRAWASLLHNNYYFMLIGLCGTFFVAFNYLAQAGWSVAIKRVPEAMGGFLKYAMAGMILIFIFGHSHLYFWTHAEYYDPKNAAYDPILVGKSGFLNTPFYIIRILAYAAIWVGFTYKLRRLSLEEDIHGGVDYYKKAIPTAAIFMILFAITSSTSAWDMLMTIDAHWFSTLFGWYNFAGMFVSGSAMICLIVLYLKGRGYMENVNENHLHDVSKFMFAFTIFWTYLWFSQFMLIWYANLPEEVVYYKVRWENFRTLWATNLCVNFILPFIILMSRDAKRQRRILWVGGIIIICGHWLDVFMMVMPGTVGTNWHIGYVEIGTMIGYLGLFIWSTLSELSKAPLTPQHHPMLQESIHHHI